MTKFAIAAVVGALVVLTIGLIGAGRHGLQNDPHLDQAVYRVVSQYYYLP